MGAATKWGATWALGAVEGILPAGRCILWHSQATQRLFRGKSGASQGQVWGKSGASQRVPKHFKLTNHNPSHKVERGAIVGCTHIAERKLRPLLQIEHLCKGKGEQGEGQESLSR